jgi:hypothetical protein
MVRDVVDHDDVKGGLAKILRLEHCRNDIGRGLHLMYGAPEPQ